MEQAAFLEKLIMIFDQSANAYHQYVEEGKTFRSAQELKLCNGRALQLLEANKTILPGDWQNDIESLLIHYGEWSMKWEKLAAEKQFGPADVFVFANDITFPKQAAQHLEAVYRDINQQVAAPQKK